MKYFNIANWREGGVGEQSAYDCYLDSIKDLLPDDLRSFNVFSHAEIDKFVSLYDCNIESIKVSISDATVEIVLRGGAEDGQSHYVGENEYVLQFTGVVSYNSTIDSAGGMRTQDGYTDLGGMEIERLEGDLWEQRFLFASGIEIYIVFREFRLTTTLVSCYVGIQIDKALKRTNN